MIFSKLRSRGTGPERMDDPSLDPERFIGSLNGLRLLNGVTGSARILWPELLAAAKATPSAPLRVLDVACGGGDVPIALSRRLRAHGLRVEIDGCDVNALAIQQAEQHAERQGVPANFFRLDVLKEAIPDGYDVVMSSLFLHHLSGDQALVFLSKAAAAARGSVLIHDLVRCLPGLWLAQLGVRAMLCNDVCVHDGPRSVENAFTIDEVRRLALDAGLKGSRVETRFPYRLLLKWSPDGASA